jgi:hypothetical protein
MVFLHDAHVPPAVRMRRERPVQARLDAHADERERRAAGQRRAVRDPRPARPEHEGPRGRGRVVALRAGEHDAAAALPLLAGRHERLRGPRRGQRDAQRAGQRLDRIGIAALRHHACGHGRLGLGRRIVLRLVGRRLFRFRAVVVPPRPVALDLRRHRQVDAAARVLQRPASRRFHLQADERRRHELRRRQGELGERVCRPRQRGIRHLGRLARGHRRLRDRLHHGGLGADLGAADVGRPGRRRRIVHDDRGDAGHVHRRHAARAVAGASTRHRPSSPSVSRSGSMPSSWRR